MVETPVHFCTGVFCCYFGCTLISQTGKRGLCFINIDLYSKKSAIKMQVNL